MHVLLFCEAVTLAHSARVAVLARGLAARGHRVTVAGAAVVARFGHPLVTWRDLVCIGSGRFVRALSRGTAAYALADLQRYIDDERRCIDEVAPDFIAADFRPTVAVSARLARMPCASIVNAYWSPAAPAALPMPVLPFTHVLPLPWAQHLFDFGSRWVLPSHCRPWNRLRVARGMVDLGADLRRIYTEADHVFYPDIPGMFALHELPANHHFLGPLLWSPAAAQPTWWPQVPHAQPVAYVTLGSSGDHTVLRTIIGALMAAGFCVIAASVGANAQLARTSSGVFVAEFLPGDAATARSDIVVCNGGAMTCHQAFACGRPVLGIASNMDQFLNMQGITAAGAGLTMRADRVSREGVRRAALALLNDSAYRGASRELGRLMQALDPIERFERAMHEALRERSAQASRRFSGPGQGDPVRPDTDPTQHDLPRTLRSDVQSERTGRA